jgi:hypothetical protein
MASVVSAAHSRVAKNSRTTDASFSIVSEPHEFVEGLTGFLDVVGSGLELFLANPVFSLLYYLGSLLFFGSLALGKT